MSHNHDDDEHDHDEPHGEEKGAHERAPKGHAGHGGHEQREGHSHDHTPKNFGRAFAIGIALQSSFVLGEIVVGFLSHSLAVIADAGHNVSDVLALALAWGASSLARRNAMKGRTYGMKSASIMAAVFNSMTLLFVNGAVAWEAIGRLQTPEPVMALPMIVVSLVGIGVNAFCAWLFARGSEDDVNVRAAFLHLASDAVVAAGVSITGIAIYFTGYLLLDPIASLVVAAVVLASTWSLLKRAIDLAMHAVPQGVDEEAVRNWLQKLPGVTGVHDLHIWAMSTTENVLTAHITVQKMPKAALATEIDNQLRKEFKLHHVTIQIDPDGAACFLGGDDII